MPSLAPHIPGVPESGIRRIHEIAITLDGVIMLDVGEPDVAIAPHVAEAAKAAWDADFTHYTPNGGIAPLRTAIVDKLARENGLAVEIEQVWVTIGATQALHQAMALTLAPGDEVLIPDPGYTTFTMNAHMLEAVAVPYPLRASSGFMPDVAELEHLVTEKTRVLIINSPSNPLGAIFPRNVLEDLLDFARRHDLWVISDEVYEQFTWEAPHVSVATLGSREDTYARVFSVFALSKTYAMTGIRIGYLVTPPGLSAIMRTVQEAAISCVAGPDQFAAVAALTGEQGHVAFAREHYRENLDAATALLDGRGFHYLQPGGAFYLWIDVSHVSDGDVALWAERFLRQEMVAVAPGSAFGRSGEGWIRVCLAAQQQNLLEGLRRLPAPEPGTARKVLAASD